MQKPLTGLFILENMKPVQVGPQEFEFWWKHQENENLVECTPIFMLDGEHELETVFTGIGPYLYKTYIKPGLLKSVELGRYRTLGAAKIGHWKILDGLIAAGSVGHVPEQIDF